MVLSKAITGGFMPMSVVCTTEEIYAAFLGSYESGKAFMHSHTYAGNPLACACANAVLDVLKRDDILQKAKLLAPVVNRLFKETFMDIENVGEVRQIGLINAIELVKDRESKEAFSPSCRLGYKIYQSALSQGLLLRPIGDVLYFNPPLNIELADIKKALNIARNAITGELAKLS